MIDDEAAVQKLMARSAHVSCHGTDRDTYLETIIEEDDKRELSMTEQNGAEATPTQPYK